ncbi:MAG TPA: hypothetical protein VJ464_13855 [Blastocatellia bacterium]|nr:hypothetical protein [Blastocatellia bacterium]
MKQRGNFTNKKSRRARLSALVFLCLMMHALFVCLTHHHSTPRLSSSIIVTTSDSDSQTKNDAGSDASCLSCRLQRNFVPYPHPAATTLELVPQTIACQTLRVEPLSQRLITSLFGRAPPLV